MRSWSRSLVPVVAMVCFASSALAQSYPSRVITLIVPYAAGGGTDVLARALATELTTRLKQTVVVDNIPGAGGTVAVQKATNLAPDGYSLVLSNGIEFEMLQMADPEGARGRATTLTPIALIGTQPMVLVARSDLGFKTADDLVAAARAKPGALSLASSGPGTSLYLAGELFKKAAGISTIDVPYKSAPQIVTDLMGGNVDAAVLTIPTVMSQLQNGKITALAVTDTIRSPALPNVPSMSESRALKSVDTKVWYGVFGPPKTPAAIVKVLEQQIGDIVEDPAFQAKLGTLSIVPAKQRTAHDLDVLKTEQLTMFRRALGGTAAK